MTRSNMQRHDPASQGGEVVLPAVWGIGLVVRGVLVSNESSGKRKGDGRDEHHLSKTRDDDGGRGVAHL